MTQSIQIRVAHPSPRFSGERTFYITEDKDGLFAASCSNFGSSRFYSRAIDAVLSLVEDNGGSEERIVR